MNGRAAFGRGPAVLLLALALGLGGCDLPTPTEWLGAAQEAHQAADAALARGDRAAARAALAAFVEAPRPLSTTAADRRIVVQDACFRLATLALEAGDPAAALAWAERGLLAGQSVDVFTANLLVARGKALEATGEAAHAAVDYLHAQRITERLLEDALDPGGEPE